MINRHPNPPSNHRHHPPTALLTAALAAATCTIAIAACGSPTKPAGTSASTEATQIAFSQCMRSHGVPNYPDPSPTGGGPAIGSGTGLNPESPAFQSAAQTCRKLSPGSGPREEVDRESLKLSLLKHAQCMRTHGVPNYPDPNIPSYGPMMFGPPTGPGINLDSPAFKRAATACGGE